MKSFFDLVTFLANFLVRHKKVSALFIFISLSSILLVFSKGIEVKFDLAVMGGGSQAKASGKKLNVIFSKEKVLNGYDICALKKTLSRIPREVNVVKVRAPFFYTIPFESNGRLLFKELISINCHEVKEIDYFVELKKRPTLFEYYANDGTDLKISLEFDKDLSGSQVTKRIDLFKTYLSKVKEMKDFEIYYEGSSIITYYVNKLLVSDFLVNVVFLLVFLVLFKFIFNSIKLFIIFTCVFSSGIILILPLFSLLELSLNPLTLSVFVILALASIEDFIFIFNDFSNTNDIGISLKKFMMPSLLTSLTTVIGFGSLTLSNLEVIQKFGIITAFGAVVEWVMMFLFLPLFFNIINPKVKIRKSVSSFWMWLSKKRISKFITYFSILPFVFSVFSYSKLSVNENVEDIFFGDHEYHSESKYYSDTRGFKRRLFVQVQNEKRDEVIGLLKDRGFKYNSLRHLKEDLLLDAKGESREYLLEKIELYSDKSKVENGTDLVTIFITKSDMNTFKKVKNSVEKVCKTSCEYFGKLVEYSKYSNEVMNTFKSSFLTSLLIVGLTLFALVWFKTKSLKPFVIYSALWGCIMMFSVYYIFNIPLNFISTIFFSVFLGLSGDNVIQYLYFDIDLNENKVNEVGISSFIVLLFTIGGAITLSISNFKFTAILGIVFVVGFIMNFVGDFILLKGKN